MQGSVAAEVRWRVDTYQRVFEFCRQGGFSFARFVALVPDRLRLASGDAIARVRIPVAITEDLSTVLSAFLPNLQSSAGPAGLGASAEARRIIRLAQLDPGLSPGAVAAWLMGPTSKLAERLAALYRRGFEEIGRGGGGEETAYLVHLLLVECMRRVLRDREEPAQIPSAVLSSSMVEVVLRAASEALGGERLSARLGFSCAVTLSPVALGANADEICARPINCYRTTNGAMEIAGRVIREPLESIPLQHVAETLAQRYAADDGVRRSLLVDAYLEMVRDCLLLLWSEASADGGFPFYEGGEALLRSGRALTQHLFNERRRRDVQQWVSACRQTKAVAALVELLDAAPKVQAGDSSALGIHGDMAERARLAARGAVALLLDAQTEVLQRDLTAIVEEVPAEEQARAYDEGRCYRLSFDERPLFRVPKQRGEAWVYVDLRGFLSRVGARGDRSVLEFLERRFYRPVGELYRLLRGSSGEALSAARIVAEGLAFRGDIVAAIEMAARLRELFDELSVDAPVPDVLGGAPTAIAELEGEIERLQERSGSIDGALRRTDATDDGTRFLLDGKALIEERLALLEHALTDARERNRGARLEGAVYVSYGAPCRELRLSDGALGHESVAYSQAMEEAYLGTARSAAVRVDRDVELARARQAFGCADAELPFRVSVRKRHTVELPPHLVARLVDASGQPDVSVRFAEAEKAGDWLRSFVGKKLESPRALSEWLPGTAEIYNAGCAVSEEALGAYRRARGGTVEFETMDLDRSALPDGLRQRLLFEHEPERLVIGRSVSDRRVVGVFRYAGSVHWEGRNAESRVWELVSPDSELCRSLLLSDFATTR